MLIVEELHLLLLRRDGRAETAAGGHRLYGEIATVIVDLALHGRVTVTADKSPVVRIVSAEPIGHPVLDAMLARLVPFDGKTLQSLLMRTKMDPRDDIVSSLVDQGVLVRGERGFFGLGAERTPEADPGPEALLRARLAAVLAGTAAPTQADLTLLSVLQALGAAHSILRDESGGLSAGQLKKRIGELTAGTSAGDAVPTAVNSAVAATLMLAMTPVFVATTMS